MNLASTELDSFTGVFTVAIVGFDMALIMRIPDLDSKLDGLAEPAGQYSNGCIGTTRDLARSVFYLAKAGSSFPDGGIASRLHDPD